MIPGIEGVSTLFEAEGWREVRLSAEAHRIGIAAAYDCSYAAVALVPLGDIASVVTSWAACQSEIAILRKNDPLDRYLVFLVPEITQRDGAAVAPIVSDTHVCRKLCIGLNGKQAKEAIHETPFFLIGNGGGLDPSPQMTIQSRLAKEVPLQDLAKRSVTFIVDQLLVNGYRNEKGQS